jgi:subtilisin family serine protease
MRNLPSVRKILATLAGAVTILSVVSALPLDAAAEAVATRAVVDPVVQARVATAAPDTKIGVIVVLREQAGPADVHGNSRPERLRTAEAALRAAASHGQRNLLDYLDKQQSAGNVSDVVPLWIEDAVSLNATPGVLDALAKRDDVAAIRPDRRLPAPEATATGSQVSAVVRAGVAAAPVEPNVALVNAPALWDLGYRGQGVVVASMDTGVDATHPDLAGSWRGGSNSWYDPYGQHPTTPTDVNGHGSQTTGVIVGGEAGGSAIGVAPQAQWIGVKIFNDSGTATSTAIHLGYQWLLDPDHNPATPDAPHVVNNSWTMQPAGCVLDFQPDLRMLRSVGILPIFAAGNYGPTSGSVPSPANNPEAVAVGGTTDADVLDPQSSVGPSACAGATSPALTAPDTNIHTADLFGGYVDDTGTSVAAPHVTGAVALLLSAFPDLKASADAQQSALQAGAHDLGSPGLDSAFGYGRLDVLAAYQAASTLSDFSVGVAPSSVNVPAGGATSLTVTISSIGGFAGDVSLAASGLPADIATSLSPATVPGGSGTSQLTLTTQSSLAPGSYPFTITGTSGGTTHSTNATLVVTPAPDFTVAVTPSSRTVNAGSTTTYTVNVGSLNGFTGDVALTLSGLPGNVASGQVSPGIVTGSGTATVSVSIAASAPAGSYPFTVTGTSGGLSHTATATLVVRPRDFTVAVSPATVTVSRGGTASYTVTVTGTGGFTSPVSLSVGGLPNGATAKWTVNPVSGSGSSVLKVKTSGSTRPGTYSLIVTGASGVLTHQATATLVVRR